MDCPRNVASMAEPSEEQKKQMYDNLPSEQKKKQSYIEWVKEGYNNQYEKWMPWIEDQYLKWVGKDNKASYTTKNTLNKSKVTGIKQVDQIQNDVHNLAGNQVGKDGLLAPVGNMVSKEGINRAERGGKDDKGTYSGRAAAVSDPVIKNVQTASNSITGGANSARGYVGGMFGGKEK